MSNFNLNDFFAAFNSLKARGTTTVNKKNDLSKSCCGDTSSNVSGNFDCSKDEEVKIDCDNTDGWTCRHTPKEEPPCEPPCKPPCEPPSKPPCKQPRPPFNPPCEHPYKPQPPSGDNINTGIIDGNGNDIYGMGNSGIIDTDGNDIYTQNYNHNVYNTTNNYYNQTVEDPEDPEDPEGPSDPPVDPEDPEDPTDPPRDFMPLISLVKGLEARFPDGILSDKEIDRAMLNPTIGNLDEDSTSFSAEELAILQEIKDLNEDKTFMSKIIKGDLSDMDEATLDMLFALSERIRVIKNS